VGLVDIKHVSHTYFTPDSATSALENITLYINEGEFVSFLGPSGCGKTTLLSIIAGLFPPSKGTVLVDGLNPHKTNNLIGYMLQQDYLFPWKTIKENVLLGLEILGAANKGTEHDTLELLKQIGLNGVENQYPGQLSGGMRQRAALVRTLAVQPKLLLLDEPFSALDYQTKLKLEDLVVDTLKAFQKTAVLVTHDIGEAICMSDRIFLFSPRPGRLHQTFIIPDSLRKLTPFEARNHQDFPAFFQMVWKELEGLESSGSYPSASSNI